ncbi:hypothetical protein SKAU_G00027330 [Synaphobranchus kaupii]|uniref:DEP domain-containing protein 4 n=1 Tax=Synaphobranchus kaupii TaxID=118154 RepID=A0A9Q1GEB0_SYNKA|nr:hypothetical protein SKAU_G00027330 [Synaphobranchus kaupii]
MAVDLTPRFRRLNSQTRSIRENAQIGFSGPFRATQLWRSLILALHAQLEALMEARVFEPVGIKLFRRQKDTAFEDSSCSLYRFLDSDALPGSNEKDNGEENVRPDETSWRRRKIPRLDQMRTISNPLAMESSDRRLEKLLQTINLHPCTPSVPRTAPPTCFLSKTVVEEVWKQQTLVQLLQIVDLPILDSILTSPGKTEVQRGAPLSNHAGLVISNTYVDREVTQSLNLPELDFWLAAAADCLEHFPDQLIVVAGEHLQQGRADGDQSLAAQKRLLFDTINYSTVGNKRMPSWPPSSACGCCSLTRGPSCTVCWGFMAVAAHPESVRLHRQADNRATIIRTFLKAIVQNNALTRTQSEELVLFLMDNRSLLFKTPASLTEAVRRTLQALQQGGDADITAAFSFCQRVTEKQYEDQRERATLESLKQLIRHISLSASMPLKEKRRLIKDFQKHHPVVFLQHFSSTF